jgi:ABC-type phosphate/phosphonate transport system ATPase subunit
MSKNIKNKSMKVNNVSLAFKNKVILKDVNIDINPGDFVFLIGYS